MTTQDTEKKGDRIRGWVITINEKAITSDLCYENMTSYISSHFNLKRTEYYAWNEERGESGNLHIHLYIEFKDVKTFSSMCKHFPGAHIEERKGTPTEARNYLIKAIGNNKTILRPIQEWGDFSKLSAVKERNTSTTSPEQPKITLNQRLKLYVKKYNSVEEVEDVDLWFARQFKSVLAERFLKKKEEALFARIGQTVIGSKGQKVDMMNRKIYYLYGDSRVGKTFGIKMKYGSANVYTPSTFDHLWDDYRGQAVLNLDEFRSDMPFRELLVLFQGYREHNKLSARYENNTNLADTIILSTNLRIEDQYQSVRTTHRESWQAFYNRFNAGIWEMVYSPADNLRLLCCISSPDDYSAAARDSLDFSDPPVDINDGVLWIHDTKDFDIAKRLVHTGRSATLAAIEAEKAAIAKAAAEKANQSATNKDIDDDVPF